MVMVRGLLLTGLLVLGVPRLALAQLSEDWYVNPYLGGITPDKPWHASGSGGIYGLDIGTALSAAWSAELDLSGAPLRDRTASGDDGLYGAALEVLRVFDRGARFAPYLSFGAGLTHYAPSAGAGSQSRTEFMMQPGAGVMIRLWESADGSRSLALRPDIKVRWTHGWAHAPGNPVDPLYVLGLTYSFGPQPRSASPP
jgi:Outer membrane protein beta-barrel domain